MKTCYVSIPFGIKLDSVGAKVDFDQIYARGIKPAVEGAGLTCLRADELPLGAMIHKSVISAVLASEVMIADITTANPNVMYELGIRHTAQSKLTMLLMSSQQRMPFDINYSKAIIYEIGPDGVITEPEAERLRHSIASALRTGLEHIMVDSPLYEFFPDLRVDLPESLMSPESKRRPPARKRRRTPSTTGTPSQPIEPRDAVNQAENEALNSAEIDPIALVNVLKAYRDISAWDDVIRLADAMPAGVAKFPEVRQLLALALNRRGSGDDQDRAIAVMTDLIKETGGDAESYGILGRIYKDRYFLGKLQNDLDRAIHYYREGFVKDPFDYYPGVNVVTLLLQKNDEPSRKELEEFLPTVQNAVNNKMKDGLVSYWDLATALHLAAVGRQWPQAAEFANKAIEQSPPRWMLQSTLRDLESLRPTMDPADVQRLDEITGFLRREGLNEEGQNAYH